MRMGKAESPMKKRADFLEGPCWVSYCRQIGLTKRSLGAIMHQLNELNDLVPCAIILPSRQGSATKSRHSLRLGTHERLGMLQPGGKCSPHSAWSQGECTDNSRPACQRGPPGRYSASRRRMSLWPTHSDLRPAFFLLFRRRPPTFITYHSLYWRFAAPSLRWFSACLSMRLSSTDDAHRTTVASLLKFTAATKSRLPGQ